MQNAVMVKRSEFHLIFFILLPALFIGSTIVGVLFSQDSAEAPVTRAAALLSRSYLVEHLDVETAAVQVRQALDPAEARVFIDRVKNRVVIKGNAGVHQLATEMLKTIDRPPVSVPAIPIPQIHTVRQLRCYLVAPTDVRRWSNEINRRYSKIAGVRITPDVQNGQITVVAPVAIHQQLGDLLNKQGAAPNDDWKPREEQQAITTVQESNSPDTIVAATRVAETNPEEEQQRARTPSQRRGAFPVVKEKPLEIVKAPATLSLEKAVEAKLPESPAVPQQAVPVEVAPRKRKIVSAFPQSQGSPGQVPSPVAKKEVEEIDKNIMTSIKKDLIGGVKSIDGEFRSLHHKISKPVTGFFEFVQEDISISVTDLAKKVSERLSGKEKDEDSKPRAARVIRVGEQTQAREPKKPAEKPKPLEKPAVERVPLQAVPKKPAVEPTRTAVPRQPRKVVPSQSPVVAPPAPQLPGAEKKQSTEAQKPLKSKKPVKATTTVTPAEPIVLKEPGPKVRPAPLRTPAKISPAVIVEQKRPVKPASTLVETDPVSEPPVQSRRPASSRVESPAIPTRIPAPSRVALPPASGTAAAISLVGASDKEIIQFVARHLRMQDAGDLAGCEIRMTLSDRQVWLVLEQDNGTMVRVRVGEVKLDRDGRGVLLVDPEKLQR